MSEGESEDLGQLENDPMLQAVNRFSNMSSVSLSFGGKKFQSLRMQPTPFRFHVACVAKPDTVEKVCKIVRKQLALSNDSPITGDSKFSSLGGRRIIAGGAFGGMKETQEMIDFAAKQNIWPEVELIPVDYVSTTMERLLNVDVKYRFVIDIGNTLKSA